MKILSAIFTVCILAFSMANAQLVINEYSASNLNDFPDNFAKYEDWIELHNLSSSEINLEGYYLSDKSTKPTKWEIPAGISIGPNQRLVFWCSGRDVVSNNGIHTNFKLTQTKGNETLMLVDPQEIVLQQIDMELTQLGHSRARVTNGSDEWRIDTSPSPGNTNDGGLKYTAYAETPMIDLEPGFYQGSQTVTIQELPANSTVRFTTDGREPTTSDAIYSVGEEIIFSETTVVKAKAFPSSPDMLPSKVDFKTYFVNEDFTMPVFSVAADNVQDLANGQGALRPQGTLEYFDKTDERIAASYGELNRHGQDSWILDHRSLDWISRDEMGYNKAVLAELFTYSDRDEYQRFMFRASGDDNYPANDDFNHQGSAHVRDEYVHTLSQKGDMKLDVRALERVVVFLNGDYWGVYGLRERPTDHDYTKEYYDQEKFDLQYLTTWGGTQAEYGGQQAFDDWGELRDFILDNDMADEDNYEYVKSQLQVKGLCDYMIANLNTVASDWLNYNTGWWRGLNPDGDHKKWGYILWDNDATFDYYINYSGVPNTDPDATACDIEDIADFMDVFYNGSDVGQHEKIFLKILDESTEFQQLYFSRQADLLNTVYSCENMTYTFDSLISILNPEMGRQINRWGGSMAEWQTNVQQMRLFIEDRCQLIDDGMVECYDLTGPHSITLNVEPAGAGEIEFNTLDITSFPWTGNYFGNMENIMEAKSNDPDLDFLYWTTENGSIISPDSSMAEAGIMLEGEETLTAVFGVSTQVTNLDLGLTLSAYPTVFVDQFNIALDLSEATDLEFELVDMNGKIVMDLAAKNGSFAAGKTTVAVSLDQAIPAGMYLLQVKNNEGMQTIKIMSGK